MNMIFYNDWESFFRALVLTFIAYISMILLLRISGKRTLSKMNAFDFIVTIALGSSLASIATSKNLTIADGIAVFGMLIFMQFLITWLSVRNKYLKRIITSEPSILLYKGKIIEANIRKERVTVEEIKNAVRSKGISNLDNIDIIILETTGDITIIKDLEAPAETVSQMSGNV